MCAICWYGYNTPKWKAFECSMVLWRREIGKRGIDPGNEIRSQEENDKINHEWINESLPYDPWFETDECLEWIKNEWPNGNIKEATRQAIEEWYKCTSSQNSN